MKLALAVLCLFSALPSFAQPKEPKHLKTKDAVKAARLAATEDAKERSYKQIAADSIEDDQDVRALAAEISEVPKIFKGDKARQRRLSAAKHLAKVLAECKQPKHHAVIKELLDDESRALGRNYMGPWGSKSEDELESDTIKYEKLKALADAAGNGKNELALPALRAMRKKGGQAGKLAETTIGKVGRDEDLDEFVREIKSDPRSLVSLYGFGRKGFARVSKELNDPTIPAEERVRLAGALPTSVSHDDLPDAAALLKHSDPRVVSVAARTVANSLTPADDALLRELLKSKDQAIRGPAILSIDRNWDPKYIPDLIEVLRKDPNDGNRSAVAHMLGTRKVKTAEADIRAVATADPVPWVRESAQEALNSLSK